MKKKKKGYVFQTKTDNHYYKACYYKAYGPVILRRISRYPIFLERPGENTAMSETDIAGNQILKGHLQPHLLVRESRIS